jgi:hypothetical protein
MNVLEEMSDLQLSKIGRLGFYPGSFDPLHDGHLAVVRTVLAQKLCDAVFICCINGYGFYKQRSDFEKRTKACFAAFANEKNVILSRLSAVDIQEKMTLPQDDETVTLKFRNMTVTGIMGSDVAYALENPSENEALEKSRRQRQEDFMRGHIIIDTESSVSYITSLPASDFIVACRGDHTPANIPAKICGRRIRAFIDIGKFRYASSSKIKITAAANVAGRGHF